MKIRRIIWRTETIDKLIFKHGVESYEVEEVFRNRPRIRFAEKGEREDEDVYLALGQPDAGRYLAVYFIYKVSQDALILSARDMVGRERGQYGRK